MLQRFLQATHKIASQLTFGKGSRNDQERIDTQNLNAVLSFWKGLQQIKHNRPGTKLSDLTSSEIDGLISYSSYTKNYFKLREENCDIIDYQIYSMFKHVQSIGGLNPYPRPVYRPNEKRPTITDTDAYLNEKIPVSDIELFHPGVDIYHPGGFQLQVKKSIIDHPESGYGVHVSGEVIPGTIIGFYPGTIYFPTNITKEVLQGNDYMISRYDDVIVDGRSWDRKQEIATREAKQLQHISLNLRSLSRFRNPFGIGNYINHPPKGGKPNVMAYSYDFPLSFPQDLSEYIPNEYFKQPTGLFKRHDTIMHSVLIVATRRIEDEELFLNYRYNPANPYPDWYEQPDLEEAQRRWGKVRIL